VSYTYDLPFATAEIPGRNYRRGEQAGFGVGLNGQTTFQSGFPLKFGQSVNSVADGAYAYYFGGGPSVQTSLRLQRGSFRVSPIETERLV